MLSIRQSLTVLFTLSLVPCYLFSKKCTDACCNPQVQAKCTKPCCIDPSSQKASPDACAKKCTKSCCAPKAKKPKRSCRACKRRKERGEKEKCRKCRVRKKRHQAYKIKMAEGPRRFSLLDYEGLKKEKNKLVEQGKREIAVKYIEKMVQQCTDLAELSSLMLELADLLFDLGRTTGAETLYNEFVHLYPGDDKAEYANYKAILCSFWATLDHFRDQSKTKETIEAAQKFLERKEVFTTYTNQVQEILTSCHGKLFESEVSVFQFYLKRGDYLAAKTRLENIEKEFIPLLPAKEPVLMTLACDLAEKKEDKELLAQKQSELEQKFPEFTQQRTVVASTKSRKQRSHANRF